tara:strand:+ start:4347 stop:4931 length:585 start_codon:yes stop_codon:yes gene_type:complete
MPLETIFLFVIADLMFCLTPGPATMVTVSHALPHGPAGGMRGALGPLVGVNVGNFIWYALTAFGLIALINAVPTAYAVLRWIGVAYLAWMAFQMLRGGTSALARQSAKSASFGKGFVNGLVVHMSNPKALLFYTAFIPPFIDPDGNLGNADQAQPVFQKIAAAILLGAALILAWWNLTDGVMQSAFNLPQGATG